MIEALFLVFISAAGFATGTLGLLMLGHLMGEDWLEPIRPQAEAAALTTPLLLLLALPLAFNLDALYPWAGPEPLDLPPGRAAFLDPAFFVVRSAIYIAVWTGLALWITRARNLRRASAIGLALLAPTAMLAANDWVLSRDPFWWSSLFGFAFAASQLLAALAGGILISGYSLNRAGLDRLLSLERALLSLALVALWMWFAQFLIVWLANLPAEAAWYLARADRIWLIFGVALPAIVVAVFILAPRGASRALIVSGGALLLLANAAHLVWIIRPAGRAPVLSWIDPAMALAVGIVWAAWFAFAMRRQNAVEAAR